MPTCDSAGFACVNRLQNPHRIVQNGTCTYRNSDPRGSSAQTSFSGRGGRSGRYAVLCGYAYTYPWYGLPLRTGWDRGITALTILPPAVRTRRTARPRRPGVPAGARYTRPRRRPFRGRNTPRPAPAPAPAAPRTAVGAVRPRIRGRRRASPAYRRRTPDGRTGSAGEWRIRSGTGTPAAVQPGRGPRSLP